MAVVKQMTDECQIVAVKQMSDECQIVAIKCCAKGSRQMVVGWQLSRGGHVNFDQNRNNFDPKF